MPKALAYRFQAFTCRLTGTFAAARSRSSLATGASSSQIARVMPLTIPQNQILHRREVSLGCFDATGLAGGGGGAGRQYLGSTAARLAFLVKENIRRFGAGLPLLNVVDKKEGF